MARLVVRLSAAMVVTTICRRHPTRQQKRPCYSSIDGARPGHCMANMDISRVDLPLVFQRAADKALAVVRLWWPGAAYHDSKERIFLNHRGRAYCMLTRTM